MGNVVAKADNTDIGDPFLENLTVRPARQIRREAGANGPVQDRRKKGFNKLFVVVTEGTYFLLLKVCLFSHFSVLHLKRQLSDAWAKCQQSYYAYTL